MNHGESHPRDPEVAYKMRKIQITNKKKIGNCRLVRLSKTNRSRFEIPNRLRSVGDSGFVNPLRSAAYESVPHAPAGAHLSGP
jgi:hypothetical protein